MDSNLITYQTELSTHVVQFCRFLRAKGFAMGPAEQSDALQALATLPFTDRKIFRLTLRAMLTKSLPEQQLFDKLYPEYWQNLERAVDSKVKPGDATLREKQQPAQNSRQATVQNIKNWLNGDQASEETEMAAYSAAKVLTRKDFSLFSENEIQEVMTLISAIAKTLATRFNRRFQRDDSGNNFDLRRTMRQNLRRGGEIIELEFRKRRQQRLRLVVLCDVSKSMDLYSRFLLHFLFAFQNVYKRIETFVFSTSLHRVTESLRTGNFAESLQNLSESVPDWSGGTKIGASLRDFVENYGSRLLDHQTVVVMMSDGWDTGNIDLLSESMAKIHQKAARVIWLNPLAGSADFQPTVRGMQAAWPHIDVFAPVHNVESLRQLIRHLKSPRKTVPAKS